MPGPHEDINRMAKVTRLADAFTLHAKDAIGPKDLRLMKRKKVSLDQFVAIMAKEASDDLWQDLAQAYDIRPPSTRTIAATKLYLERKAEFELPANPLAGLPTDTSR